jgi:putative peptidoglycan lipid II flippase
MWLPDRSVPTTLPGDAVMVTGGFNTEAPMTMSTPEFGEETRPLASRWMRTRVDARPPTTASALVRGTVLAGRYRLTEQLGVHRHVQFWQGVDTLTGQPVGLSLVDVERTLNVERVNEILSLTVRLRGLDVAGIARILDVLHTGEFGVVASEWVPGRALRDVVTPSPSAAAIANALKSLIVAADAAHRAGSSLSVDHPARIRIGSDGHAVLAFPATLPDATPQGDLWGIGGALYALLINRWPPAEPMPAGWTAADVDEAGWPKEPATVDPRVPFLLSSAAAGLVRRNNGVGSAAALLNLLRLALDEMNSAAVGGDSYMRVMPPLPLPARGSYAGFRNVERKDKARQARRQLLEAMFALAAAIIVLGVTSLGSSLNRLLDANDNLASMDTDKLGLRPSAMDEPPPPTPPVPPPVTEAPIRPASAAVFSPDGQPDNPDAAEKAIDGDPATAWATDRYYDADPFPKFKEGLGLLIQLPQPFALDAVTVDLNSTGTVIQIRGASAANPQRLADTVEMSPPTPMQRGSNRIALNDRTPTSTVLVWIATLGDTDGARRAEISEVSFSQTPRA